jgi:hypothetical protein
MNMIKHTPGPWRWTYRQVADGRGAVKTVAVMLETEPAANGDGVSQSTILAVRDDWIGWMNRDASSGDRALIGAAPELLAALKLAAAAIRDNDLDESMAGEFEIITDAIAKAEGKTDAIAS